MEVKTVITVSRKRIEARMGKIERIRCLPLCKYFTERS
jgi:hypothetical protein